MPILNSATERSNTACPLLHVHIAVARFRALSSEGRRGDSSLRLITGRFTNVLKKNSLMNIFLDTSPDCRYTADKKKRIKPVQTALKITETPQGVRAFRTSKQKQTKTKGQRERNETVLDAAM